VTRAADALERVRRICLALPESEERRSWGTPAFRVRDRQFAIFLDNHHGDGRVAVWCVGSPGMQESLVSSDAEHFFVPPYVGPSGWIGVRLDRGLGWDVVGDLLRQAHEAIVERRPRKKSRKKNGRSPKNAA
jgi:predicted DNA-binding protein (MmcQ/YjbR family)